MAGEMGKSAWVKVGPPLSCSGPRLGLPESELVKSVPTPVPSPTRSLLPDIVALFSALLRMSPPAMLLATMLLFNVNLPLLFQMPPPRMAELPLRVELLTVTVPSLKMPPPPSLAELLLRVELLTVNLPPLLSMPPPTTRAELLL